MLVGWEKRPARGAMIRVSTHGAGHYYLVYTPVKQKVDLVTILWRRLAQERAVTMGHTIKSLNLNIEQARLGRVWLLLPREHRDIELATQYPLPYPIEELLALSVIPFRVGKHDSGSVYLRRCKAEAKARLKSQSGSSRSIEAAEAEVTAMTARFNKTVVKLTKQVQQEAKEAIASLDELFALGRKGLEGQMKAHLSGQPWQGEEIDSDAFRQCFRMVSQSVKGLGLPSTEEPKAREAVMEQYAASIRATQEAEAMKKFEEVKETEKIAD